MAGTFTRLYYHFVWATRNRQPLLTPVIEPLVHDFIRHKSAELKVLVHAVNGMPDHLHLACTLPTRLSIADFTEAIKGSSSHFINHRPANAHQTDVGHQHSPRPKLYWQGGHGAMTLNQQDLERVVAYIDSQKEHHRSGTLLAGLERFTDDDPT